MWRIRSVAARVTALVLAILTLVPAGRPPSPALAQDAYVNDHRDPEARLEMRVNSIHIYDDHDWGEGEIGIEVWVMHLRECPESERGQLPYCRDTLVKSRINFGADDGDTVAINRVIPGPGDEIHDLDNQTGPGIGFPGRSDHGYVVSFHGIERDEFLDDQLGRLDLEMNEANGWGPLGSYNERGWLCETKGGPLDPAHFFSNLYSDCNHPAAFSVDYELHRAALPDLVPTAFRVIDSPGAANDSVCMTVQNIGLTTVEGFRIYVQSDDDPTPVADHQAIYLDAGQTREDCVPAHLPASGPHQILTYVDRQHVVPEMNDQNNGLYSTIEITPDGPPAAPSPSPLPLGEQHSGAIVNGRPVAPRPEADLKVGAIRIKGHVPDGKNDCTDGKNDVSVVVKNAGTGKADSAILRLAVDGDQPIEKQVNGLDAGKEQEVRFGGVRLKKGEHTLTASVNGLDDHDNTVTVTARCTDAG
jgi:hypothetical protein